MQDVDADANLPIFRYVESWNQGNFAMSAEAFQACLDIIPLVPEIQGKRHKDSF